MEFSMVRVFAEDSNKYENHEVLKRRFMELASKIFELKF